MCRSCLSWYGQRIAPYLVHAGCSSDAFSRMRRRMVPHAKGVVVEVGLGSGLNLPHYDAAKVTRLVGVDPDATMLALAKRRNRALAFDVECLQAGGESMPLADGFADTVVVAYAFCTVPQPEAALAEIRRILKPDGRLIFLEHGQANASWRRRLQDRLNRPWGTLAGGCNLNRNPFQLVEDARFDIRDSWQERFPPAFWLLGSHYAGIAIRRSD
ncbi:class I SAM-dependent methyltransferase [Mesorhizobium sp. 1M-11]|uniref:class I SAM-dependent methyltransferase n=1 Tax=Mesorhizobium sp. 1M-11 TaxID=1529006 RepID=UPI0006C74398|nr:class I SAM-dependent methyltransferase [Mesorhizobium sp. 1M-11]